LESLFQEQQYILFPHSVTTNKERLKSEPQKHKNAISANRKEKTQKHLKSEARRRENGSKNKNTKSVKIIQIKKTQKSVKIIYHKK